MSKSKYEEYNLNNNKQIELTCPKCDRRIQNYFSPEYALRPSALSDGVKICAYCFSQEYFDDKISKAKRLDELLPNFFSKLADEEANYCSSGKYKDEYPGLDDTHGGFHISQASYVLEKYYSHITEDLYNDYPFGLLSSSFITEPLNLSPDSGFYKRASHLYTFNSKLKDTGLSGKTKWISTENNLAVVYTGNYDLHFISNNYYFPYEKYYLSKEVIDKFTNLDDLLDVVIRLNALEYVSDYDKTSIYATEIASLNKRLQLNRGLLENDDRIIDMDRHPGYQILDKIDAALKSIQERILGFGSEDNLAAIKEYHQLMDNFHNGIFDSDGSTIDLTSLPSTFHKGYSLWQEINEGFTFNYMVHVYILFGEWIISREDNVLDSLLKLVYDSLLLNMSTNPGHDKSSVTGLQSSLSYLGKVVNIISIFFERYEEQIESISYSGAFKSLNALKNSTFVNNARTNSMDISDLTEESIALYLINFLEPLTVVNAVLKILKDDYDRAYAKKRDKHLLKDISVLRKINNGFNNYYGTIIDIFYINSSHFRNEHLLIVDGTRTVTLFLKKVLMTLKEQADPDILDVINFKRENIIRLNVDDDIMEDIEDILSLLSDILNSQCSKKDDYHRIFSDTKAECEAYKAILDESTLKTLATAEYLYDRFITNSQENDLKDYSCISIMYYRALEDALNKLIYFPYRDNVLANNLDTIRDSYNKRQVNNFLPGKDPRYYLDNFGSPRIKFKAHLMMGNFRMLFISIRGLPEFGAFLSRIFKDANLDLGELQDYGASLGEAAKKRNNSAHGGQIIDMETAKTDRSYVYAKDISKEYKVLLLKLLDFFK
ncbi:MAG: hypothetical protein GX352_09185 [Clostridiales bacterium]|nr:hypothetical protein [Clostridiales bacterium]